MSLGEAVLYWTCLLLSGGCRVALSLSLGVQGNQARWSPLERGSIDAMTRRISAGRSSTMRLSARWSGVLSGRRLNHRVDYADEERRPGGDEVESPMILNCADRFSGQKVGGSAQIERKAEIKGLGEIWELDLLRQPGVSQEWRRHVKLGEIGSKTTPERGVGKEVVVRK